MSKKIQNSRIQSKYSTISGSTPTIPSSNDHTDGSWGINDIYIGELYINAIDNKVFSRGESSIFEVGLTDVSASITGFTYNNANTFTINDSTGGTFNTIINTVTGLTTSGNINPVTDNNVDMGSSLIRFRDINTVNGHSTVWTSTTSVTTASLELGLDSSYNYIIITANNSIIQDDLLNNGTY
jgi:hypothetical protein